MMNAVQLAVTDGVTITKRNSIKILRSLDLLGSLVFTPVMFVLLFGFVFGSVIDIPGLSYREFMLPGIFTLAVAMGGIVTGYGLTDDLQKGIIDRFRSLPMSPAAVLIGRTTADLILSTASLLIMGLVGLLVGWRIHTGVLETLGGVVLLLAFSYALSWVMGTLGLAVRKPEVFNNVSMVVVFPLTFLANTFVDSGRLPTPLRVIADWNPVSAVTQAARELFGNTSAAMPPRDIWPMQHALLASVLWIAVLLAVFVPLSVRCYKKATSH
ncbi:ABC transporter [Amycolatopsis vastitatis]|uniref:Transport permease protein n=2 Tax=Amycolatopsis vastitatis TaxID=1905142 RepID=A0A229ST29_9PSEU|nr:ABC transporter [Amycolatopsis vastitatis]